MVAMYRCDGQVLCGCTVLMWFLTTVSYQPLSPPSSFPEIKTKFTRQPFYFTCCHLYVMWSSVCPVVICMSCGLDVSPLQLLLLRSQMARPLHPPCLSLGSFVFLLSALFDLFLVVIAITIIHIGENISQKYQRDHNLRHGFPDASAPFQLRLD